MEESKDDLLQSITEEEETKEASVYYTKQKEQKEKIQKLEIEDRKRLLAEMFSDTHDAQSNSCSEISEAIRPHLKPDYFQSQQKQMAKLLEENSVITNQNKTTAEDRVKEDSECMLINFMNSSNSESEVTFKGID